MSLAAEQATEALVLVDPDGRVLYLNPACARIIGLPDQEILGQSLLQFLPGFPLPTPGSVLAWQGRTWTTNRQGQAFHLDGTISPVLNELGQITSFMGALRNVTQEVETERNQRHLEKMDALGNLASGVAHDSNNILTAILSASELIEWQVPPDSPIMLKLHVIYQAVMRARELNRQILSFSRGTEDKHVPFDLSAVVKEAMYLLRSTFPASVEVRTDITSGLWVLGDSNQLHQVVMNLAVNALQAMLPQGGTLDLSLEEEELGEPLPSQPGSLKAGRYAVLTVRDTGCGMDEATQERIFEPFFTTKGEQGGTGLGLSVAHGIVYNHQGTLSVQSQPGHGSTFQMCFPATARDLEVSEETSQETFGGNERILLVDDEEVLGALCKQGLQLLGYRVTARSDSQEALEEFQHRPQDFDLLITDLAMPGLSGVELTSRIRKIRPDLPAILITGAFQVPEAMDGISTPFDDIIFKPVTIHEMAKSIRHVINLRPVPVEKTSAKEPSEPAQGAPAVLLAEDSSVTRGLLRSWLTKAGYRVQVARDGQEAWEAFEKASHGTPFGLVLTDIVMPRMDGLKLAAKIREVDPSVPIVILSTSEDADSVKEAIHLRVNEFLTKPFESAVLIACVERIAADHATRMKGLRSVETAQAVRMAQRAMEAVPEKNMPIYSISEPLTDAGGDVFRCHRLTDGSIFFAIADVAGHSVISSYAVAAYLGMLSNFVGECVHLRPLLEKGSRSMVGAGSCTHFGTTRCEPLKHLALKLNHTIQTGPFSEVPICSLFGIWTPATGRLHLLNAGIPHAHWYRHDQGRTCALDINGAPLGILDDPPMEEKVIAMGPGDRLLLGSDGFFDALSPEKRVFEPFVATLWRDLACTDILTAINLVSESARVHAAGKFNDDLLVVGLEQPDFPADAQHFAASIPSDAKEIDRICEDLDAFLEEHHVLEAGPHRFETLLAVREALSNAMLHGNASLEASRITLRSRVDAQGQLQVAVLDEGLGFDLDGHQPPDTDHSERGRGIPMIQHYAEAVVMTGGELLMTFRTKP
jgi:signal transduction histidine kinase/DNA-binding response OmpR family regulator